MEDNHKEAIIQAAFKNMLGRPPSEAGLSDYLTKNLSYEGLCEQLRTSKEYRLKHGSIKPGGKYRGWPFNQIFVAQNIKVIYNPIAKNSCTTHKTLMVELSDVEFKRAVLGGELGSIHNATDNYCTGVQLKDLNDNVVQDCIESPDYFRFAILRDPAARLLSGYWEKFVVNRNSTGSLWHTKSVLSYVQRKKGLTKVDADTGITFSDFVSYILETPPHELDSHWRPQYVYLQGVQYTRLYNMKNLTPLYEELGKRAGKKVEADSINRTDSGVGERVVNAYNLLPVELERYGKVSKESFYNQELLKSAFECYSKDYELLDSISKR